MNGFFCEHGNEPSVFIIGGEVLDWPNCNLLTKVPAART